MIFIGTYAWAEWAMWAVWVNLGIVYYILLNINVYGVYHLLVFCRVPTHCTGHYDLALVPGGVFLTSLNYWRLPTYGWRRNLDVGYVCGALIYQNIRAYNMPDAVPYYYLIGIGSLFYPLSNYLYKKKCYWGSTCTHCMLHIVANIANAVLYSGGDVGGRAAALTCDPGVDM